MNDWPRTRRTDSAQCNGKPAMRLVGTDREGNPVWVKDYRRAYGFITTSDPEEAQLFHDQRTMRVAFQQLVHSGRLHNVTVQIVPVATTERREKPWIR